MASGGVPDTASMTAPVHNKDTNVDSYTLTFVGDVMLGRLIDQLLPTHVDEPEEADIVSHFRSTRSKQHPHIRSGDYDYATPWGNSLALFHSSDLVLANLETSMTTHDKKWPDKVFNYRSHPENVKCLLEAGIDYVSLANNHTLDFSEQGLKETVRSIREAGIAFAGAGESEEDAGRPAVLRFRKQRVKAGAGTERPGETATEHEIHAYSFSDHPDDWKQVKGFNSFDYSEQSRERLKQILSSSSGSASLPSLKIISLHWGPNYSWEPHQQLQSLAHFLIDECDIDIIHGHSSHHVQGVEVYKKKLILYGCGDFVDDYAVTAGYRNDLSAAWRVTVSNRPQSDSTRGHKEGSITSKLDISRLEVFPNRIAQFQAGLLDRHDPDHEWFVKKFKTLCEGLGTKVESDLGKDWQMIVDMNENSI